MRASRSASRGSRSGAGALTYNSRGSPPDRSNSSSRPETRAPGTSCPYRCQYKPMNTSLRARYARYTSAGGYGRAPTSNITGVSRSAEMARETARRSSASSPSVELTNTRSRWSGVRMTVSYCGPWLTDRPDQAPPRKSAISHSGQQAPHATKGDSKCGPRLPRPPRDAAGQVVEQVVTKPQRVEPDALCGAGHREQLRPPDAPLDLGQLDTDAARTRH